MLRSTTSRTPYPLAARNVTRDQFAMGPGGGADGVFLLPGPFATPTAAHSAAWDVCSRARERSIPEPDWPALEVVGDFVVPPPGPGKGRDFQALHFDFGLPLDPRGARDVAHYTALYISPDRGPVEAGTRLVRLDALLAQRGWATRGELIRRFRDYGLSHGAWDPEMGYSEGILGRLVEASDGCEPVLPSVSATPGFLCGTEFASADDERRFFEDRGLRLDEAEAVVELGPGQLLVFDNLGWAHGRRGRRRAGELHQRIFGYRDLCPSRQRRLRNSILRAFVVPTPGADGRSPGPRDRIRPPHQA